MRTTLSAMICWCAVALAPVAAQDAADKPAVRPPAAGFAHGRLQSVDLELGTLELLRDGRADEFNLAGKDTPVTGDVAPGTRLEKLPQGTAVLLRLGFAGDVVGVHAVGPVISGRVKGVDAEAHTISLRGGEESPAGTLPVAEGCKVVVNGRFRQLRDVPAGKEARLKLTVDRAKVVGIQVSWDGRPETPDDARTVDGVLRKIEPASGTIGVALPEQPGDAPKSFELIPNAVTSLVDGRGNNLGDLLPGMKVKLWLSSEGEKVLRLKAEPQVRATVKRVDPLKRTVTWSEGDEQPDRTLPVAEGARVLIDGWESELQDFRDGWRVSAVLSPEGDRVVALWTLLGPGGW